MPPGPHQLRSEQPTGPHVPGQADLDGSCPAVVPLVIVRNARNGQRLEARLSSVRIAQTRGRYDAVERFDHLRADGPLVLTVSSQGVLSCYPALLVRGCAKRQIAGAVEEAVMRVDTVPCSPYPGNVGPHLLVDGDGFADTQSDAGVLGERGVGTDTGDHEEKVGDVRSVAGLEVQPPATLADSFNGRLGMNVDSLIAQVLLDLAGEVGVECARQELRELFENRHLDAPRRRGRETEGHGQRDPELPRDG